MVEPGGHESPAFLSTSEAANLIGISRSTLARWADEGRVAFSLGSDGRRRFLREDIEAVVIKVERPTDEAGQ
jgi:excisionase family DNA binding protein